MVYSKKYPDNKVYDKKNQEDSLVRREKEIKSMARASLDPLIMINGQGVINFWNPAAERLFGYQENEALGVCIHTLLAVPEDRKKALEMIPKFVRTGKGPIINNVREIQARCKNGSLVDVEQSVAAFEVNGQWHAVGVLRDITERKKNREALQLARHKLEEANRQLLMELLSLSELQQSLLPEKPYATPCLFAQGLYQPSGLAAGDYFDYLPLAGSALRCIIADVSGHGARAAFIMSMVRTFFHFAVNQNTPLSNLIEALNRQLIKKVGKQGDFVTLLVADIYPENGCIEYINAGHCPAFFKEGKKITEISATSPLLGVVDTDFPHKRLEYRNKWELLMYTDGFYECRIQGRDIFGYDSFKNLCVTLLSRGTLEVEQLPGEVAGSAGGIVGFDDDLTALHVVGQAPAGVSGTAVHTSETINRILRENTF